MNVISTLVVFILEVSSVVVACAIRKHAPLISSSVEVDNVPQGLHTRDLHWWFVSASLSLFNNTNLLMGQYLWHYYCIFTGLRVLSK